MSKHPSFGHIPPEIFQRAKNAGAGRAEEILAPYIKAAKSKKRNKTKFNKAKAMPRGGKAAVTALSKPLEVI